MLEVELGFSEYIALGNMLFTIDGEDEVCMLGRVEGSWLWKRLGCVGYVVLGGMLSTKDGWCVMYVVG